MKNTWSIRRPINKIVKKLKDMSIIGKFTYAYIILILIPSIIIGAVTYRGIQNYIVEESIRNAHALVMQTVNNLNDRVGDAESITSSISQNSMLRSFLNVDFELSGETLAHYEDDIQMLMEDALSFNKRNIYKISVYKANTSIPEAWPYFYNESRIVVKEWYKEFLDSNNESIWVFSNQADSFESTQKEENSNRSFLLAKKINTLDNEYKGTVVLGILEKDMLKPIDDLNLGESDQVVVSFNGTYLNLSAANSDDFQKAISEMPQVNNKSGYYIYEDKVVIFETLKGMNFKIYGLFSLQDLMKNTGALSRNIIYIAFLGFVFFEILTYLLLKKIFTRLKHIVKTMNTYTKGNFELRIQADSNDEVGQIAADFNILMDNNKALIDDIIKREIAQRDAQIMALHYQINPHFIYNTMDIFRMKLELQGVYDVADSIVDFSDILRYNLDNKSYFSKVRNEIQNVKNYMSLQKLKYGDNIALDITIAEELLKIEIIKFMLQPIVENSVKHGFETRGIKMHIEILFVLQDKLLSIVVKDNGTGINARRLEKLNHDFRNSEYVSHDGERYGIGLQNINERIKLIYGSQYYIRIESDYCSCTRTIVKIPVENI